MDYEYGILTNEIYKSWSGMKASELELLCESSQKSLGSYTTEGVSVAIHMLL